MPIGSGEVADDVWRRQCARSGDDEAVVFGTVRPGDAFRLRSVGNFGGIVAVVAFVIDENLGYMAVSRYLGCEESTESCEKNCR